MVNKIIAVDLDDTLWDTIRWLLKYSHWKIWWIDISFKELNTTNLWEIKKLNITMNKSLWLYMWFLMWVWIWNHIDLISWAKQKLFEFKKKWYDLHIVTARHKSLRLSTWIWLYRYYKNIFSSVNYSNFLTSTAMKKSEICKKLWANIIIEDNLENAIDCANEWIKVYLLDNPWNQDYDRKKHKWIIKVKNWNEINI